jgi:fructose-1,6-bisphosphatase/sedoheptulose 1,7-bisphosphatase-like protein
VATSEGQCVCGRFSSVTEGAALAAAEWTGRGDGLAADLAAREAMAAELAQMPFRARVVAGRGGNEAPNVLRLGDEVGGESDSQRAAGLLAGGAAGGYDYWDLAVVPLEGHAALAAGEDGAVAMIAAGPSGSLMSVPDMYMQKLVVPGEAAAVIDIEASVASNVSAVAAALGRRSSDLIVVVLDRPRHEELIAQIRRSGARLKLIADGDLSAGLAAAARDAGADMCIGIGGSTRVAASSRAAQGGRHRGRRSSADHPRHGGRRCTVLCYCGYRGQVPEGRRRPVRRGTNRDPGAVLTVPRDSDDQDNTPVGERGAPGWPGGQMTGRSWTNNPTEETMHRERIPGK